MQKFDKLKYVAAQNRVTKFFFVPTSARFDELRWSGYDAIPCSYYYIINIVSLLINFTISSKSGSAGSPGNRSRCSTGTISNYARFY